MRKPILAALALAALAACAPKNDLKDTPPPLGRFLLGTHVVITDNMQESPISRDATGAEWNDALQKAVTDRFGRYDGDTYYDMAITVEGYALAPPGIPVVLSPKSVLILQVVVWYDSTRTQLNPQPKRFIVFEGTSPETVIGSGLTRTKAQQMAKLSFNAVKDIEGWFLKHPEWFPKEGPPTPESAEVAKAEAAADAKAVAAARVQAAKPGTAAAKAAPAPAAPAKAPARLPAATN